jgi:hypothetical protein
LKSQWRKSGQKKKGLGRDNPCAENDMYADKPRRMKINVLHSFWSLNQAAIYQKRTQSPKYFLAYHARKMNELCVVIGPVWAPFDLFIIIVFFYLSILGLSLFPSV